MLETHTFFQGFLMAYYLLIRRKVRSNIQKEKVLHNQIKEVRVR